ncbi:hypothetical protein [Marinobacter lipolyticus]|uniref:hypothetical protein n=1 Tax=Marinobacter lipolyticus TaxID=209639 RepID=UPI003A8E289F
MDNIEKAVEWITDGDNIKAFREDFSVIEAQFPDLSDVEKTTLKTIHEKGLKEWDEEQSDVVGQSSSMSARSYGW